MQKATHLGTCQICGSVQKLPDGALAKHGYTTRWGFFSGTCSGSGHAPFEQSCNLIQTAIKGALSTAEFIEAQAAEQDSGAGDLLFRKYVAATWKTSRSSYEWVKVTAEMEGNRLAYWVEADGTTHSALRYSLYTEKELRAARSKWLRVEKVKYETYANWQAERIADWAPQPLTPVA